MQLSDPQIDALVAMHITRRAEQQPPEAPPYTKELDHLGKLRAALDREGLALSLGDDDETPFWQATVRDATGRLVYAARDDEPARAACVAALMAVRRKRRAFEIPIVEPRRQA